MPDYPYQSHDDGFEDDPWSTELEALQCIIETQNIRFPVTDDKFRVCVQVLYGADGCGDEYWVQFVRTPNYPQTPLAFELSTSVTKLGTTIDLPELESQLFAAAKEAAEIGAEALFSLVNTAKELVEKCIEQDTQAALRMVEKMDRMNEGPIMKVIAHDADLVQVYRTLDLTETTVLLTPCQSTSLRSALSKNIDASIKLYEMLHGEGVWSHLYLDGLWEVGFDSKDKSYAARRFNERKLAVSKSKRRLLWHGSAVAAIACILTNGSLRKVHRATHGRMFGDGVYFTDCMCKALSYCSGGNDDEFYLMLCSVDVGKCHEFAGYMEDLDQEILDSRVTLAVQGQLYMKESTKLETGEVLTIGGCQTRRNWCAVNFNEFIVFREDGHVNKYLARLKLKPRGVNQRRIYGR